MTDASEIDLAARVRKLPGELLLALVNGTAVLVIVASVLALIAYSKVEGLASAIGATMTDAILSRVDIDPKLALVQLQGLATDVRGLTDALKGAKLELGAPLASQIEKLNTQIGALQVSIAGLSDRRSLLINDLLVAVGRSLAEGLEGLRACSLPAT